MAKVSQRAHSLLAVVGCEHRAEPIPPQAHGFVTEVDPALEQKVVDVSQA